MEDKQARKGRELDDPREYEKLTDHEKASLHRALMELVEPGQHILKGYTTYGLKHLLPMYITNGCMKAACIAAGFRMADMGRTNWSLYARFTEAGARTVRAG